MSDTTTGCEVPLEELMERDLAHYEEAATSVNLWSNQVPQAIRAWYGGRIAERDADQARRTKCE